MVLLQVLDLSYQNNLVMKGNFRNLCSLQILDLTATGMNGDIAGVMEWLSHCVRDVLQGLHLAYNNFTGPLPNLIRCFHRLTKLDLSCNKLTGSIPTELANCSSLVILDLSKNQLSGNVPIELGAYANLTSLVLSYNNFIGVITEEHLVGLTSLKKVDLSSNSLKVSFDKSWLAPFSLKVALFGSCKMGPLFPAWFQRQLEITTVDLSISGLMGKIPDWFWSTFSQATYIDISGNKLSGSLPAHLGGMAVVELYLGSNRFTGPVPLLPRNISVLDISNNSFSGTLPSDHAAQAVRTLLMYSNQIGGIIPESLCKLESLEDLDLSNNLFEGEIPRCVETKFGQNIAFLLLSNNNFTGPFPIFLHKISTLRFLDLAWNNFIGTLPPWIGNLSDLQFLQLSHNKFSGNIPDEITNLSRLQYLDLSNNNLSSGIPQHLSNLTAMTLKASRSLKGEEMIEELGFPDDDDNIQAFSVQLSGQFGEIISIITKGQQLRYGKGLAYFVSIDLSGNSLTGEIPPGITYLDALINLNLSSNLLCGNIPNKIGSIQSLESLDLSSSLVKSQGAYQIYPP